MNKFNELHLVTNHFEASPSLISLVEKAHSLCGITISSILEVGCGQGLHFINDDCRITGIDISSEAIEKAKENFPNQNFKTHSSLNLRELGESYDLILDAHQIHYLNGVGEIEKYLDEVFDALNVGGIFCFEAMISHKEYRATQLAVTVLDSMEYESILIERGFTIKFLTLPRGRKFVASKKRKAALSSDPDVLLVIATKEGVAKAY